MKYNANQIKTNVVAGYNYCKKVYNGGIETPEQMEVFTNLCQTHLDRCNNYCSIVKPTLGILQYKQYMDYKSIWDICAATVNEINTMLTGLRNNFDKQREEAETYSQLEARMRFEAAVAYDIRETERKRTLNESKNTQAGFIMNKNNDNTND